MLLVRAVGNTDNAQRLTMYRCVSMSSACNTTRGNLRKIGFGSESDESRSAASVNTASLSLGTATPTYVADRVVLALLVDLGAYARKPSAVHTHDRLANLIFSSTSRCWRWWFAKRQHRQCGLLHAMKVDQSVQKRAWLWNQKVAAHDNEIIFQLVTEAKDNFGRSKVIFERDELQKQHCRRKTVVDSTIFDTYVGFQFAVIPFVHVSGKCCLTPLIGDDGDLCDDASFIDEQAKTPVVHSRSNPASSRNSS
jgi:hypothetical protein